MKGDFSVWRYDPHDNDQGVLYQQGRVTLDRDLTDAERIALHWRTQAAQDVIGKRVLAVPADEPNGFFVDSAEVVGGAVHVHVRPGRAWADGILLYLPADPANPLATIDRVATYFGPPLNASSLPAIGNGIRDVVVLEVALEELSAFQVPLRLLEPALGGPDTTERVTTRYAFRLLRLGPNEDCHSILDRIQDTAAGKGRLSVSLDPPIAVGGECPTVEGGGYTGFEHNLFRVEIAATNTPAPRFKWSRFNGGLVATGRFQAGTPNRVIIEGNRAAILSSGIPSFYLEAMAFNSSLGHWEVTYGAIATLNNLQDLELTNPPVFGTLSFPSAPVFIRLWNGIELVSSFTNTSSPQPLIDGIHLVLDPPASASYRPGDFWTFPVRAGEIANPEQLLDEAPPQGVQLHRVPLAEINWTAAQDTTEGGSIEDCRKRFRPLTNQKVCCTFLIGDGTHSFGDFNSLEEAAVHLPAAGGELCLLPGLHFANLTLTGRHNVRIHGCQRRTLVLPRVTSPSAPIFTINDCQGIEIAELDLASAFGPIVVATGTVFSDLKDVSVVDCRMLAQSYAVRIRRAEDVVVARNHIWMLDTTAGKAAIQVRAHRALIERNTLGVWPFELTPPGDDDGGSTPTPPSDPCAAPTDVYGNLTFTIQFIYYVWATAILAPPKQPYLAWGGIHLLGGCDNVRVLENVVDGGAGHGITLGGLLPGETATGTSPDPVNIPSVTLSVPQFDGIVRNELNQPVQGVDVSLSQGGVVMGQGTSSGPQAAVGIKVGAGTYNLSVEPGFQIVQVQAVDLAAGRLHLIVVRAVAVTIPEERAFLYQIDIRENEILRMALSGIGFAPFAAAPAGATAPDVTDPAAIASVIATAFAPRALLSTTNIVRDLTIAENRIHHNLRVVFTPALRTAAREVGQGGISLGLVENGRLTGNHVHDNGISAVESITGIFVGYGENIELSGNYVTGNGAVPENYETAKVEGLRGGIYIRFASALLVGGQNDAMQKPAVRIVGNRVDQPAGRAITVQAFGPVTCQDNHLNSERTGRFNVLDTVVGGVLILNVGGLHRQQRVVTGGSSLGGAGGVSAARAAELLLPGGEVLFNDNQVRLGTDHRSLTAIMLVTLDDVGCDGNQSSVFRRDLLLSNAISVALSQRVTDNRFREDTDQCFFSLISYSFGMTAAARLTAMNTTATNQGDHCIYATSNAPRPPAPAPHGPPVVYLGNMEVNFAVCRALLGEQGNANAVLTQALMVALFSQQGTTFNAQQYTNMARLSVNDATRSIATTAYEYRTVYAGEATRLEQTLGADNPRAQSVRVQVQRSGAALQQLEVASEVSQIKETAVPVSGASVDGRVTDPALRGKEALKVELVRADGTPVGVSSQTNEAGYFDLTLNAAQVEALGQEPKVFIRVTDSKGNVVHRDTEPVTVAANTKSRATVVVTRADAPSDAFTRGTVIFNRSLSDRVGQSTPLENVKGIGPVMASQLRRAGIPDLETLVRTPGERLVQITGFDIEIVRKEARSRNETPGTAPPIEEPPSTEPPKQEPPKQEPSKQEPPKQEPPKQEPPKKEPPKRSSRPSKKKS